MTAFLVTYDLRQPGRNYQPVWDYLGRNGIRALESVWLVDVPLTAAQVRDTLKALVDTNDRLLVVELGVQWGATTTLIAPSLDWLKVRRP